MRQKILIVLNLGKYSHRKQLDGIYRRIDEGLHWNIHLITSLDDHTVQSIASELKWRPDGLIIGSNAKDIFSLTLKTDAPVVAIDPWKSTLALNNGHLFSVSCDNTGIGKLAAKTFLAERRYHSFGFIGAKHSLDWSVARGDGFAKRLSESGVVCSRFEPIDYSVERAGLVSWLRKLPKPAAVFAANDERAIEVIDLCRQAHLPVPTRVAVLGVDNNELACRHTTPQLSSISIDFEHHGYLIADLMARAFDGTATDRHIVSETLGDVIVRGSTSPLSSAELLVERAQEFIRCRATSGISADDVARHLRVSKTLMNLRFREAGCGTVLDSILNVRIETAKRLLTTTDDKISVITAAVGYESENHFKAIFRRETGLSMSAWRTRNLAEPRGKSVV